LGGSGEDDAIMGLRIGPDGSIYASGHGQSSDFPVTPNAAQPRAGGKSDCYVVRFSADGSRLIFATYLGGSEHEFAEHRVRVLPDGSVLATGSTGSSDFPTTPHAFQRRLAGKANGFLTKVAPDGRSFVFSTFYGGSGTDFWLMPTVDAEGRIYVVGQTSSPDLPVTPDALQPRYGGGPSDGALAVFSPDGSRLLYATYLGGSGADMIRGLALGPRGEVYLTGHTSSLDFPVSAGAAQPRLRGATDAFVVKLVRR
jgi:Tol biopolymer transport system component